MSPSSRYTKFPGQRRPVQGAVSMFRNYPTSRTLYAFVSLVKIFAFVRNRDAKPKKNQTLEFFPIPWQEFPGEALEQRHLGYRWT